MNCLPAVVRWPCLRPSSTTPGLAKATAEVRAGRFVVSAGVLAQVCRRTLVPAPLRGLGSLTPAQLPVIEMAGAALSGEPAHQRPATRRSGGSDLERISSPCERCGATKAQLAADLAALTHAAVDVIRKPSSLCRAQALAAQKPTRRPATNGPVRAVSRSRDQRLDHRRPQDFARIQVVSDRSRQDLYFSAIPCNRSWGRNRGGL